MTPQKLTEEELAWAEANADAVRALMKKGAKAVKTALPTDPVDLAAHHLTALMKKKAAKLRPTLDECRERIARYERMCAAPDIEGEALADYRETIEEETEKLRRTERHIEALEAKLANLANDPQSCFLPLGTVVRFTGAAPAYRLSDGFHDTAKDYPLAGTMAVVSGLSMDREFTIRVSPLGEYKDGWGSTYLSDEDRVSGYRVDPEVLEVVGYSQLPDGTEYKGFGHIGTYARNEEFGKTERDAEMILFALDRYWRYHNFGGTQGVEVLSAEKTIDEMSWLDGPLPEFLKAYDADRNSPRP